MKVNFRTTFAPYASAGEVKHITYWSMQTHHNHPYDGDDLYAGTTFAFRFGLKEDVDDRWIFDRFA